MRSSAARSSTAHEGSRYAVACCRGRAAWSHSANSVRKSAPLLRGRTFPSASRRSSSSSGGRSISGRGAFRLFACVASRASSSSSSTLSKGPERPRPRPRPPRPRPSRNASRRCCLNLARARSLLEASIAHPVDGGAPRNGQDCWFFSDESLHHTRLRLFSDVEPRSSRFRDSRSFMGQHLRPRGVPGSEPRLNARARRKLSSL